MEKPFVVDISRELIPEFSRFCVPEHRAKDKAFLKGVALKEAWVRDKLDRGEPFARIAILEGGIAEWFNFNRSPKREYFTFCVFSCPARNTGERA